MEKNIVLCKDLNMLDYKKAWDYQEELFNRILAIKLENRKNHNIEPTQTESYFLLVEHPHVYTLGKSGQENNLLINDEFLKSINATYYKINRGGDITYHGPGQIVGYPVLDLDVIGFNVKKYIENLEEVIIKTIRDYGVEGDRLEGATGVWLDTKLPGQARKICAIGVRASRFISMHGFALNVNTDLTYFNHINPCGFVDKGVTSLQKELGKEINIEEVKEKLKKHFEDVFDIRLEQFDDKERMDNKIAG